MLNCFDIAIYFITKKIYYCLLIIFFLYFFYGKLILSNDGGGEYLAPIPALKATTPSLILACLLP